MSEREDFLDRTVFRGAQGSSIEHPTLERCHELHQAFDELLAAYLIAHPGATPSTTDAIDVARWSWARIQVLLTETYRERMETHRR